jgi:hypothetical protein
MELSLPYSWRPRLTAQESKPGHSSSELPCLHLQIMSRASTTALHSCPHNTCQVHGSVMHVQVQVQWGRTQPNRTTCL